MLIVMLEAVLFGDMNVHVFWHVKFSVLAENPNDLQLILYQGT